MMSGTSALRGMLRARSKSPNALALIASAIENVGVSQLDDFAEGRADLTPAVKQALANIMLEGHLIYNAETDRLETSKQRDARASLQYQGERGFR
jgi:hypothetical protein